MVVDDLFLLLPLVLVGGVSKVLPLFISDSFVKYVSRVFEAFESSWWTHLITSESASSGVLAFCLHNVLSAFT